MGQARLRQSARRGPLGQGSRQPFFPEKLQTERSEVLPIVAVTEARFGALRRSAEFLFALELGEPLPRPLVDELDLRFIHQSQGHPRFAGADLRFEFPVKLLQRLFAQVHRLRQAQAIELVEMMTQRRVDLGFARRRVEQVLIADAFLLRQLDRQQQQRRDDALLRRFLEIVPV